MNRRGDFKSSSRIPNDIAMRPSAIEWEVYEDVEERLQEIEKFFNSELESDDPILQEKGVFYLTDNTEYRAFPFYVNEGKLNLVRKPELMMELKYSLMIRKIEEQINER